MSRRGYIPHKEELAAALLQIPGEDGSPPIPYEHAKLMTAEQVRSCFHRDHYPIRKDDGGPDIHWNLHWRFIGAHRRKTAKVDQPQIAKGRHLRETTAGHAAAMEAKATGEPRCVPKSTIRSRPFSKQHRPMRSRNNFRRPDHGRDS